MDTPVALIIFNRPKKAARVFDQIARAKPRKLFVIADGPRPNRPEDVDLCKATQAVIDRVDWDCKVYKNYSDVNLGSGKRPATGITWLKISPTPPAEPKILSSWVLFPLVSTLSSRC